MTGKQEELEEKKDVSAKEARILTLEAINDRLRGKDFSIRVTVMRSDSPDGYTVMEEGVEGACKLIAKGLGSKEAQAYLDGYLAAC